MNKRWEIRVREMRNEDWFTYSFSAPEGFEMLVGHGILFDNEWTYQDTESNISEIEEI